MSPLIKLSLQISIVLSFLFFLSCSSGEPAVISYVPATIRSEPGPTKALGSLRLYETVEILSDVVEAKKLKYYKIRSSKGKKGYILTSVVQKGTILGITKDKITYRTTSDGTPDGFIQPMTILFVYIDQEENSKYHKVIQIIILK